MSEMREDHQTITVTLESYGLKSEFKMPFDLLDKALFDGDLLLLETIRKLNSQHKNLWDGLK